MLVSTVQLCCLSECQDSRHQPQWSSDLPGQFSLFPPFWPLFPTFGRGHDGHLVNGLHKLRPAKPGIHHASLSINPSHPLVLHRHTPYYILLHFTSRSIVLPCLLHTLIHSPRSFNHSLLLHLMMQICTIALCPLFVCPR